MIEEEQAAVLRGRCNAYLATLMPDGAPQLTPLWTDFDGESILVNTPEGTQKLGNMRRDPRVSPAIQDADDRYRVLSVRGRVVGFGTGGADTHIDMLSQRHDREPWATVEGEVRVPVRIQPERVCWV